MDIPYFITDSQRIADQSNWKPKITLPEIIEDIAKWIFDNKVSLNDIF